MWLSYSLLLRNDLHHNVKRISHIHVFKCAKTGTHENTQRTLIWGCSSNTWSIIKPVFHKTKIFIKSIVLQRKNTCPSRNLLFTSTFLLWGLIDVKSVWVRTEMCSERDSPLKRLYRRTHAKLTRLAGSGQLVWAAGCELSFTLGGLRDRARHPRQYFGWPRRAKRGRSITHEWIDPWTLLLPGQHRWARWAPQMSRASSGWPGAGKTKGSRGLSLSLHISGKDNGLVPNS